MITPPFDANSIATTHSSLTGLIAGFALAALFLLVEESSGRDKTLLQKDLARAMLLLFIASVIGTLSSFLYSSIVGLTQVRAYFDFFVSAPVFAITTLLLLTGVNEVLRAVGSVEVTTLARRISYFVILFSILRVWQDLSLAANVFGLGTQIQVILAVAFIAPFAVITVAIILHLVPLIRWVNQRTFSAFCYASVLISFGIAFVIAAHNMVPETQLRLPEAEPVLLMVSLSCLGTWAMMLLGDKRMPVDKN